MKEYSFSVENKLLTCNIVANRNCQRVANLISEIKDEAFFVYTEVKLTLLSNLLCQEQYKLSKNELGLSICNDLLKYIYENPLIKEEDVDNFLERMRNLDCPSLESKWVPEGTKSNLVFKVLCESLSETTARAIAYNHFKDIVDDQDISKIILLCSRIKFGKYVTITREKIKDKVDLLSFEQGFDINVEELL